MKIKFVDIPVVKDPRGNIAVVENISVPFKIKRVYYLYDVPSDGSRGGHAHKKLNQFLIPLSGSFDVIVDDGSSKKTFTLNKPNKGLYIPNGIWREMENFSAGAICLVLASDYFDESDYFRDYKRFIRFKLCVNHIFRRSVFCT